MGEIEFSSDNVDLEEVFGSLDPITKTAFETGNLSEVAAEYKSLYDLVEIKEREIKDLKKKKRGLEILLHDAIRDQGLSSIKTEDGSFTPTEKERCSIVKERQEEVFQTLDEYNLGDMVRRTIPWQTLNKAYTTGLLKDILIEHADLFKTWTEKVINIRRSSGTL